MLHIIIENKIVFVGCTKIYKWLMRDYIVCRMYDINSTYGTPQQAIDMTPAYFASDVLRGDVKEWETDVNRCETYCYKIYTISPCKCVSFLI